MLLRCGVDEQMVADEAGLQLEGMIDSAGPVGTGGVKAEQPGTIRKKDDRESVFVSLCV
jgi:hypothetical protein